MVIPSLIQHKRDGNALEPEEWKRLIRDYTEGQVPDYQMSALLMAVVFRGLASARMVRSDARRLSLHASAGR